MSVQGDAALASDQLPCATEMLALLLLDVPAHFVAVFSQIIGTVQSCRERELLRLLCSSCDKLAGRYPMEAPMAPQT